MMEGQARRLRERISADTHEIDLLTPKIIAAREQHRLAERELWQVLADGNSQ